MQGKARWSSSIDGGGTFAKGARRPEAEVRREKEHTFTPFFVSGIRYAVPGTTSLALGVGVAFDAACKDRVPFE